MFFTTKRRPIALEVLEDRLTPTGLGLGLTLPQVPALLGPLAGLTSSEGHSTLSLSFSLQLPSAGHDGPSLGVDIDILPLRAGVGTGSGLLLLVVELDLPALPPVSLQTGVGSGGSLLSVGVKVDPPAPPAGSGHDLGDILPPVSVPAVTPPAKGGVTVITPPSAVNPASPAPPAGAVFAPVAFQTPLLGEGFRTNLGANGSETRASSRAGANDNSIGATQVLAGGPMSIESFLPPRRQESAAAPATAYSDSDEMTDDLFSLRDGALLEDFGTTIGESDSASEGMISEPAQAESDGAMSLWLLGILAGCAAGSALLNRRMAQAVESPDVDLCAIPVR